MGAISISFTLGCVIGFFVCLLFGAAAKSIVAQHVMPWEPFANAEAPQRGVLLASHSPVILVLLAGICYIADMEKTSSMLAMLFVVLVIARLQGPLYGV